MVSQSGSRTGLIATLVVFIVLFLVAAIFAVMNGTEVSRAQKQLEDEREKHARIVSGDELARADREQEALRDAYGERTLYDITTMQRLGLARLVAGERAAADPTADIAKVATDSAAVAISSANARLKAAGIAVRGPSPDSGLVGVIDSLARSAEDLDKLVKNLTAALEQKGKDLEERDRQYAAAVAQYQKNVENSVAVARQAEQDRDAYRTNTETTLGETQKALETRIATTHTALQEMRAERDALQSDIANLQKLLTDAAAVVARYRPKYSELAIRRADGKIIQLDKNNVVYINLGLGDQITPGMTFAIYDRVEGVPALADDDDIMPEGKGSLEVVRVGPGSSECRLIKVTQGKVIVEGDVIANLIYDPNIKYRFKIYGDFDLDQNGMATPQETEVVKRLVVQWGGLLTDDITIETDFVVMGKEPVVPNYTREQLEQNALLQLERDRAIAALDAYTAVLTRALSLHVPVLNQNRFLHLIGFYEQAKR